MSSPWARRGTVVAFALALVGVGLSTPTQAAERQDAVVATKASAEMPRLVATPSVSQPHVNALAGLGATMFAGGRFDLVEQAGAQTSRGDLVAFDRSSGELSSTFTAGLGDGEVWALAADPATSSLYVGGKFTTIGGANRPALAKLDATTGAVDPAFTPPFGGGQINDLQLVEVAGVQHLLVAGTPSTKLLSLNPRTGRKDGWMDLAFSEALKGSTGAVAINHVAIDPDRTRMVVTGNFAKVDGQSRSRLVVADLDAGGATVSPWYYPGFAKSCRSTTPSKIDYLEGVDFSPDGRSFTVAATGYQTVRSSDIWYQRLGDNNVANTAVCDAVGRFDLDDSVRPSWINYTGGDTVWAVRDTGTAVYVAGHFRWLDNPDGYDSVGVGDRTTKRPAARRQGVGAIDPATGLALTWNPGLGQTKLGGRAFLSDGAGLWIGNDATTFSGAPRRGLQFAPLP